MHRALILPQLVPFNAPTGREILEPSGTLTERQERTPIHQEYPRVITPSPKQTIETLQGFTPCFQRSIHVLGRKKKDPGRNETSEGSNHHGKDVREA